MIANVGTMRGGPCSLWPRRFPTDLCHVPPVVLVVTAVASYYLSPSTWPSLSALNTSVTPCFSRSNHLYRSSRRHAKILGSIH